MSSDAKPQIPSMTGQPTWEVAALLPHQGFWSEADFLELHTNRMAELVDGRLEVLPMPTWLHQLIVIFFLEAIKKYVREQQLGGMTLIAPLPSRILPGRIREPDVMYIAPENLPDSTVSYPEKLDFVVEVVSQGEEARRRDYEHKRSDYARAGISEYWIVDPEDRAITVLGLDANEYKTLAVCRAGETAYSQYFNGFSIDVDTVFALAEKNPNV